MLGREGILNRFKHASGNESKSHRSALSKEMATGLAQQFSSLYGQDLSGFTYEQRRSAQTGAKFDVSIYDAAGVLRYEGRRFNGSEGISFWKPGAA